MKKHPDSAVECPDLQKLVEKLGDYSSIPLQAWRECDAQLAAWQAWMQDA